MSEEIRHRILAAAARVYAQYGFRGATTRLIAADAGVNEVTLFRTFGSKADLLEAMLQSRNTASSLPAIADDLSDPERAIVDWCAHLLDYLRGHADIIRKTIAEAQERPTAACQACEGSNSAGASLFVYMEKLRAAGLADPDADLSTAVSMFMSAMFGDALYRDIMPQVFPQPVQAAAAKYVAVLLRAVGFRAAALPAATRPARVAGASRRSR